jgi:hypothetical protein
LHLAKGVDFKFVPRKRDGVFKRYIKQLG